LSHLGWFCQVSIERLKCYPSYIPPRNERAFYG
jgi:hypothetical protein